MFNNVWFYILLYVVIGMAVIVTDNYYYKKTYKKFKEESWATACEFQSRALISVRNGFFAWVVVAIFCALWPITSTYATIRRKIVQKRIIKKTLDEKEWKERFDKIAEEWLAQ